MALEIERRFLIHGLPQGVDLERCEQIRQGYLAVDACNEVRVRESDGLYQLTVKHGTGLIRTEVEVPLTQAQFDELWPLSVGRQLEKRRFCLPAANGRIYIDEYVVPVSFWLAEVEFDSEAAAARFISPAFLGPDVTEIATLRSMPALIERLRQWQATGQ